MCMISELNLIKIFSFMWLKRAYYTKLCAQIIQGLKNSAELD